MASVDIFNRLSGPTYLFNQFSTGDDYDWKFFYFNSLFRLLLIAEHSWYTEHQFPRAAFPQPIQAWDPAPCGIDGVVGSIAVRDALRQEQHTMSE